MQLGVHINNAFRKLGIYSSFCDTCGLSEYSNSQQNTPTWLHCCFSHQVSFMAAKRTAWRSLCTLCYCHVIKKIDQWQHTQVYPAFSKTSTHSFICFCLFIKLFSSACLDYILLYQTLLMHIHFPPALCEYSVLALGPPSADGLICVDLSSLWHSLCAVTRVFPFQTPVCSPNVSATSFIIDSNQRQRQTRPRQMAAPRSLALFVWAPLSSAC